MAVEKTLLEERKGFKQGGRVGFFGGGGADMGAKDRAKERADRGYGGGNQSGNVGGAGSDKGGDKKGKTFSQKLKEKQLQNKAALDKLENKIHNEKAIKEGTAVTNVNPVTGEVNYVMNQGKIVTYSGGAAKKKADAQKRAAELAQKELQQQGINVSLGRAKDILDQQRQRLLDRARENQITGLGLDRLGQLNQMFGANPTTGMGLGESLRFQGRGLAQDLPGLAKAAGFVANPLGSIATGLLTGGKGIVDLLKTKGQNVLAELRDEDIVGYTDQGTPVRVGQNITETDGPGFFEGIASKLRIGEGAPFVEDRGRGGEQRGLASLQQPVVNPVIPQPIQNLPITTQPVTGQVLNQYLALAGFSPQEIQGMPSAFRFIG